MKARAHGAAAAAVESMLGRGGLRRTEQRSLHVGAHARLHARLVALSAGLVELESAREMLLRILEPLLLVLVTAARLQHVGHEHVHARDPRLAEPVGGVAALSQQPQQRLEGRLGLRKLTTERECLGLLRENIERVEIVVWARCTSIQPEERGVRAEPAAKELAGRLVVAGVQLMAREAQQRLRVHRALLAQLHKAMLRCLLVGLASLFAIAELHMLVAQLHQDLDVLSGTAAVATIGCLLAAHALGEQRAHVASVGCEE